MYEHTAVHMCAVIGVPDDKWGEVGLACVVLKPGEKVVYEGLQKVRDGAAVNPTVVDIEATDQEKK